MALVASLMQVELVTQLITRGLNGSNMVSFTQVLSEGVINSIVGTTFDTVDTGSGNAAGVGTGIGITGVSGSQVSANIFSACFDAFGQSGEQTKTFTDAIGAALENQLKLATLNSTHNPVATGTGTIVQGSIGITTDAMTMAIYNAGLGQGFNGSKWLDFAGCVGKGVCDAFSSASGVLTITGSPSPPTPLVNVPNTIVPAGSIS